MRRLRRRLRPAPARTAAERQTVPGRRRAGASGSTAALALLVALLAGGACTTNTSPAPSASQATASRDVAGLVIDIDASSPTDVRSFRLRADDGTTMTFEIGTGTITGFPPGHLQEHRSSGEKVRVTYHVDGGKNVVDGLGDANAQSGSPGPS